MNVSRAKMKIRLLPNLSASVVSFAITLLVGFWYTPFLVRSLGVETYGTIMVIILIVSYLGVFVSSIVNTVNRSLTIAVEESDTQKASSIFNTAFFLSLAVIAVLTIPSVVFSFEVDLFIVSESEASSLSSFVALMFIAFFVGFLADIFACLQFSKNRIDSISGSRIVELVVRVVSVVALFFLLGAKLVYVGVALVVAATGRLLYNLIGWKRLLPALSLSRQNFSFAELRSMTEISQWVLVTQISTILLNGIDMVVVNRICSPRDAGIYAVVLAIVLLIRNGVASVVTVFMPKVYSLIAEENYDALSVYVNQCCRLLGLALVLPVGFLCGTSEEFMFLWLGERYENISVLVAILLSPLVVNLAAMPLFSVSLGMNYVRIPALVNLSFGIANLLLALVLGVLLELGMFGVAVAAGVTLTTKNILFTPVYAARNINAHWSSFLGFVPLVIVALLYVAMLSHWLAGLVVPDDWGEIVLAGVGVSLAYIPFLFWIGLDKPEQKFLLSSALRLREKTFNRKD